MSDPRPGDRVQITRAGRLSGIEGVIKSVYTVDEHPVICVNIPLSNVTLYIMQTFQPNPDGSYDTLCTEDEYEIIGRTGGVF